jgi:hypothetical protein
MTWAQVASWEGLVQNICPKGTHLERVSDMGTESDAPHTGQAHAAEPPAHGRTDQVSMRKASHLAVHGPAASDHLASIGGLELPPDVQNRADHAEINENDEAVALIPGAREPDTLTHREPGAMGGAFTGADIPPADPPWLDDRTAIEHRREGGERLKDAAHHDRRPHEHS